MTKSLTIGFSLLWLIFYHRIGGGCCLKNMHLTVPAAVKTGESVTLRCDYDLESEELYSIKYYRGLHEFYRFVPKMFPASRVFPLPNLKVDISRSNAHNVTLQDVDRKTGGQFTCEVSTDAPLFYTASLSSKLVVADVPNDEPVLRTDVNKLTPGAKLSANCTTPGSYPSMNVTWFVNNEKVKSDHNINIQNSVVFYDALPGLETVRSSIMINSTQEFFKNSRMKIACRATLFNLYNETKELDILEDAPQLAPIREHSTHAVEGFSSGCTKIKQNWIVRSLLFTLQFHLWIRRISAT